MTEHFKVGRKVDVNGKDVRGTIAFYGQTEFATGKWIGLILDEPKGKNNGSVKGTEYFKCEENCGMFVRPQQVTLLDENGKPIEMKSRPLREDSSSGIARPKPRQSISRLSLTSSRQSLSGSRQSLSGSRHSLADSRLSLAGSRTNLGSSMSDKNADPNDSVTATPKRTSFVEQGFVETLKPHFTPGQAMSTPTPISSIEEKMQVLQLQQELVNKNQQLLDLNEKIETLKIKRQEDKDKLKDYDKVKIQLEQLSEFKSKIMNSQASLQRQVQKANLAAKEAVEAKETHEEEVADLAEAVEMATLDKEMAEEKAEALQVELNECKEKLEETQLDLEILKNEMQGKFSTAGGDQQMTSLEIKQLQQQNARLRETLVRMRDLSAHDKHEHQKLLKEMEQKNSEITELGKTKEKLSARVETMEQEIANLQEQVDAALGAEEMVVILGEKNLVLEDKVNQLEEEVSELEALQDMNNQLLEGNMEIEADLREELDSARAAARLALRDRDAAVETIADRESTINKFRDLVQKLRDQSLNLQQQLEKESSKPVSTLPDIMDFKKMFSETKAHTKAIDLELRRVDIQQLQQHIKYLSAYMPESFMNRGGDHDAVLLLLFIPRLIHKTEILLGQIKDKFSAVEKVDRQSVLKGHLVEQFAFRCRVVHYIYALQTILHQYYHALNICKPETLLKVGSNYTDMAVQEKVIDGFVELVKRDQLDENVPTEALEKCVTYFNTLFPILLCGEVEFNHSQLLIDNVKCLTSACDGINNDALTIRCLIEGANVGDIGLLAQHCIGACEQFQQQLKLVKRRLPTDPTVSNLGISQEVIENLYLCYQNSGKVLKTFHDIVKTSLQVLTSSGESEKGLSLDKIKDIAISSSDKIYEQDDLGPVQSVKNSLTFVLSEVTKVAQFLQDNEYEISTTNKQDEKKISPVQIRADLVKKELEQTKTLTSRLENKESDIKELRKVLKEKQEQLSEMTIRKELAEKKLANVNKDYELTIEKLQRKLEEAHNNYKKKEKEFEETLDHLQTDIDSLENEKGEMKEKFKMFSKKVHLETSMSKSLSGSQLVSLQSSGGPTLPAVVKDSPLLLQEISNLKKLYHQERNERLKFTTEHLKKQLDSLTPLPSFKLKRDDVLDSLYKEGVALKQEILLTLATPTFPQIYKLKRGEGSAAWKKHFAEEHDKMYSLKLKAERFQDKVASEIIKRKYGGKITTDFTIFPTKEMTKAYKETAPVNIGFVKIPKQYVTKKEDLGVVNIDIDFDNLQKVLNILSPVGTCY